MISYPLFYQKFGVRRLSHLVTPTLHEIAELKFPQKSILHSFTDSEDTIGLDPTAPFIDIGKKIYIQDILELDSTEGFPRQVMSGLANINRKFYFTNRIFRRSVNPLNDNKDMNSLTVINYDSVKAAYKYPVNRLQPYYEWKNIESTLWSNVARCCKETDRHNFIFVKVPKKIPSLNVLTFFSSHINATLLKFFSTTEEFFLLEFWKWIDPATRNNSLIAKGLEQSDLSKIDLIFLLDTKWVCLNLGFINTIIEGGFKSSGPQYKPLIVKKLYLSFLMKLKNSVINIADEIQATETKENSEEDDPDSTEEIIEDGVEHNNLIGITPIKKSNPELGSGVVLGAVDINKDTEVISDDSIENHIKNLDEDLSVLVTHEDSLLHDNVEEDEDLEKEVSFQADEIEVSNIKDEIYNDVDTTEVLLRRVDDYSAYSLTSRADHKKMVKLAHDYNDGPSPYDKNKPIKDFINVKVEHHAIPKEETIVPDIKAVTDKTMLESSLNSFDSHYVKNIMKRDIAASVAAIRRAGVNVIKHEVESVNSILGEYEVHTIQLKPVNGASSQLKFKIPVVDEDGVFLAGGKKYTMRKQQYDAPIRKINPFTVSLSSYYGKLFIRRSTKKVNDLFGWISDKILLASVSEEVSQFTEVAPGDVFDNTLKIPKLYSGLAKTLISLKVNDIYLNFNYKNRSELLAKPDELALYEKDDKYLIGMAKDGSAVLVDMENEFYKAKLSGKEVTYTPIGDVFTVFELDPSKAPIDFTELAIYSKSVPLGVVLSYYIGFSNLVKLLSPRVRIIPSNTRSNLANDEWEIKFKDKKVIFTRKDRLSTMLLAGFLDFDKSTKLYFLEAFDSKNVYLNLLDSKSITQRYIKELDLLEDMFIDPTTKLVLQNMKEPTTFKGLLLRSNELLMSDEHPASQDPMYMRVRGYERFSGIIYKELVHSVRDFSFKNIRGKSQINLNPFVIWNTIVQDPAVEIARDINPIQNLKQKESLTYTGEGGRSKDTMNKASREYHENNTGLISEATSDSSDVGINTYLSANPNLDNTLGTFKPFDFKEKGLTGMLSTSAMISPGALNDDTKRI